MLIKHCPWCAAKLPDSQRDRWFEETDALNLGPDDETPAKHLTGAWLKKT